MQPPLCLFLWARIAQIDVMALGQQVAEKEERLRAEKERDQQLGTHTFFALTFVLAACSSRSTILVAARIKFAFRAAAP